MNILKVAGASLLLPLLLACSGFPRAPSAEVVPVVDGGGSVTSNLEEVYAANAMTVLQQERLLADIERDFRVHPDVNNRLRLVLLLTTGDATIRDRARARILLEEINAATPISTSQQGLVQFLSQFLEEQETSHGQLESCTKQVTQQEQRINELEEQQRELTTIEQNIQHRDNPLELEDGR
jgi:glutathionylspermidine synthase